MYIFFGRLPVRKVHSSNIHAILNELQKNLRWSADWSNGADNAGEPHLVGGWVHVEGGHVLDVGVALSRLLLARRDIALLQDGLQIVNDKKSNNNLNSFKTL